jgi:hypothetical protein
LALVCRAGADVATEPPVDELLLGWAFAEPEAVGDAAELCGAGPTIEVAADEAADEEAADEEGPDNVPTVPSAAFRTPLGSPEPLPHNANAEIPSPSTTTAEAAAASTPRDLCFSVSVRVALPPSVLPPAGVETVGTLSAGGIGGIE